MKTTNYPKIGIRPIIDGRRGGIRESLEEMTMGMAQRVAALYAEKLRYPDGEPVGCVQPRSSATRTWGPCFR